MSKRCHACIAIRILPVAIFLLVVFLTSGCGELPPEEAQRRARCEALAGRVVLLDGTTRVFVNAVAFPEPAAKVSLVGWVADPAWVHCSRLSTEGVE